LEIVNLAVEDDVIAAVIRRHWLMTGGTQIQDRQPRRDQTSSYARGYKDSVIIWPAMMHLLLHREELRLQLLARQI